MYRVEVLYPIASWTEEEVFDFTGDHSSEEIATKFKGKLTAGFKVVVQIMRVQIVTSTRFNLTFFNKQGIRQHILDTLNEKRKRRIYNGHDYEKVC